MSPDSALCRFYGSELVREGHDAVCLIPHHPALSVTTRPGFAGHAIRLTLNGQIRQLDVQPWTTLLDLLRDQLDLIGTKKGCDHGQCGACTVLRNGKRINACLTLAIMCDGAELTTITPPASEFGTFVRLSTSSFSAYGSSMAFCLPLCRQCANACRIEAFYRALCCVI